VSSGVQPTSTGSEPVSTARQPAPIEPKSPQPYRPSIQSKPPIVADKPIAPILGGRSTLVPEPV
jgi:hypothetical protein